MSFDAGALIYKIQVAGAAVFLRDMGDADKATEKLARTAKASKADLEGQGKATDEVGKKAKAAKAPLDEQGKATETLAQKTARLKREQAEQERIAREQTAAARELSTALLLVGAAAAAMVALAVAKHTQFDQAMSNVRAATMSTAEEQKKLGAAALEAGADTAYSASEAAGAQEELAKAGLSVTEIIGGGLHGALSLAAAGQLAVARSAEIMATTLKQYKLPAEDAAHVSDLLAAGAGKAMGSVEDLALALTYVGPVAAGLGISIEETAGTLAYFAEQGILGEKAGTGLRGVIMALTAPSAIAARTMSEYGIEIFDAQGNMKSLADVSQLLKSRLGGLTEAERSAALGRIFGNEQITAARILYDGGAKAIEDWTDKVNDSGYAAEQAATRQDNLAGDIEKLGGAFDTALIQTGSGANDVLRDMVQSVTHLVDWVGDLDPALLGTGLALTAAAAAVLLLTGGMVKGVIGFQEMRRNAELLNISLSKTSLVAAGAAIAITGIITVVAVLAQAQAAARGRAEAYATALRNGKEAAEEYVAGQLAVNDSILWFDAGSAVSNAERLGISLEDVKAAISGTPEEFEAFAERVAEAGLGSYEGANAAGQLTAKVQELRKTQADAEEQIRATDKAQRILKDGTDENASSTESAAEAYLNAAGGAEDLSRELDRLIDQINEANGVGQDAITANIDYQDALAKVDEQIRNVAAGAEGYGRGLDISTQAGRDNKDMLVGLAEDAQKAAKAQYDLDSNTDAYRATLEASRQALIDRAIDLGASADEAAALADQIFRIPSDTEWRVIANTQAAKQNVDNLLGSIRSVVAYNGTVLKLNVATDSFYIPGSRQADGSVLKFYANGGTEHHVAQHARAGEWRVWAEPETEGETYIPHAASKRARSTQILAETAGMFGYQLVPAGAAGMSGGAVTATAPAAAGRSLEGMFAGASFYSYDPHQIAREAKERLASVLDAQGLDDFGR